MLMACPLDSRLLLVICWFRHEVRPWNHPKSLPIPGYDYTYIICIENKKMECKNVCEYPLCTKTITLTIRFLILDVPFPIFPFAIIDRMIGPHEHTTSIHHAFSPHAIVDTSIGQNVFSKSVADIFFQIPLRIKIPVYP
jgi:hypothetical protein